MVDTPTDGETGSQGTVSNDVSTSSVPQDNAANPESERLLKELEQARMRENQLKNQLEKEQQAKEEARKKELEQKEEYKALYESEKEKAERLLQEREAEEKSAQLGSATEEIFKDYPENVVKAAKIAGISLTDDSESARTSLKEKLNGLQETVGTVSPVTPNNPSETVSTANPEEWTARNSEGYSKLGIEMAKGNTKAFGEFAKTHPQMQRVKEIMRKQAAGEF